MKIELENFLQTEKDCWKDKLSRNKMIKYTFYYCFLNLVFPSSIRMQAFAKFGHFSDFLFFNNKSFVVVFSKVHHSILTEVPEFYVWLWLDGTEYLIFLYSGKPKIFKFDKVVILKKRKFIVN
jgi:hypothetical protein